MTGTGRLRVEKVYAACCLRCGEYDDNPDAKNYQDAERVLRLIGWRRINGKWVCKRCLKKDAEE